MNDYVTTHSTYQQPTPTSFINIVKEENRDFTYAPGEAVQSFAVERFSPTINNINLASHDYASAFVRADANPNLASGYITSDYVPLATGFDYTSYVPASNNYTEIREERY